MMMNQTSGVQHQINVPINLYKNPKSILNEFCQKNGLSKPVYHTKKTKDKMRWISEVGIPGFRAGIEGGFNTKSEA